MTQRAELRTTEPLTDLTERSVISVTRARVTVETKSSVRSVRLETKTATTQINTQKDKS